MMGGWVNEARDADAAAWLIPLLRALHYLSAARRIQRQRIRRAPISRCYIAPHFTHFEKDEDEA